MKLPSRLVIAAAALALFSLTGAAQAQDPTVLEPVLLKTQMRAHVSRSDMRLLSGTYRMEDGRDLQVDGRGLRMSITLGQDQSVKMTPTTDGIWHSPDGELQMRFEGEAWGSPETVVLSMPRKQWGMASVSRR